MIAAIELRNLRERHSVEDNIINAILEEHSVNGGTDVYVYFKKEEFTDVDKDLHRLAIKFCLLGFNLDYIIIPETYVFNDNDTQKRKIVKVHISWD